MKPLVIYHADCADGFGAAFAAWTALRDDAEYLPVRYGDDLPLEAVSGRTVYVLDFSFARPAMNVLFNVSDRVIWLDHHKTAFEMWDVPMHMPWDERLDDRHITLDNSKSGAYLAWEFFHPAEDVPMFIKHIDDYDRWQFQIKGTKAFNKALWSYAPWRFEQWVEWFYDCEAGFDHTYWDEFYAEGEAILRAHDQNVQGVVKNSARKCRINSPQGALGFDGLAANCPPHLASDVGHELATQSGTYGLCWYLSKDGSKAYCSLRSNGEYDVSAIAKVFGGGGHRNAAGFEIEIDTLLGWLL
jgi:oligoribonuclease NrnB/cAMP/cGMP phosphodiesterase (DHH superfamily)